MVLYYDILKKAALGGGGMTRSISKPVACAVLATLFAIGSVFAQSGRKPSSSPGEQKSDDTVRLRADEVLLNISVFDSYGHQATNLAKNDFIIAEDGQRQDILSFAISSVPVNVVMLLDASGSVVSEIGSLREAAMHFV